MRKKFDMRYLEKHLRLDAGTVSRLIDCGLLLPDGWSHFDALQRVRHADDGFRNVIWDLSELDRFRNVQQVFFNSFILTAFINKSLDDISVDLKNIFTGLQRMDFKFTAALTELRFTLTARGEWMTSKEFCVKTGYSLQYFHNSINRIDDKTMYLGISYYQSLIWRKMGKLWKCPLEDFNRLRQNFRYELVLAEKKRRDAM